MPNVELWKINNKVFINLKPNRNEFLTETHIYISHSWFLADIPDI